MNKAQNLPFGKWKSPVQMLVVVAVAVVMVSSQYGVTANGVSAWLGEAVGGNHCERVENYWS